MESVVAIHILVDVGQRRVKKERMRGKWRRTRGTLSLHQEAESQAEGLRWAGTRASWRLQQKQEEAWRGARYEILKYT